MPAPKTCWPFYMKKDIYIAVGRQADCIDSVLPYYADTPEELDALMYADACQFAEPFNGAVKQVEGGYDVYSDEETIEIQIRTEQIVHVEAILEDDAFDDSMDGDTESALASAGWGTDESYQ